MAHAKGAVPSEAESPSPAASSATATPSARPGAIAREAIGRWRLTGMAAVLGRITKVVEQVGAAGQQAERRRGQRDPSQHPGLAQSAGRRRCAEHQQVLGPLADPDRPDPRHWPAGRGTHHPHRGRPCARRSRPGRTGARGGGRGRRLRGCGGSGHGWIGPSITVSAAPAHRLPRRREIFLRPFPARGRTTRAQGETASVMSATARLPHRAPRPAPPVEPVAEPAPGRAAHLAHLPGADRHLVWHDDRGGRRTRAS